MVFYLKGRIYHIKWQKELKFDGREFDSPAQQQVRRDGLRRTET